MAVGLDEVVREVEQSRPRSRSDVGERCSADDVDQLRLQYHESHDIGCVDAELAMGDWVDLSVGDPVGGAQRVPPIAESVSNAESRREVVAVAGVLQRLEPVHFLRSCD